MCVVCSIHQALVWLSTCPAQHSAAQHSAAVCMYKSSYLAAALFAAGGPEQCPTRWGLRPPKPTGWAGPCPHLRAQHSAKALPRHHETSFAPLLPLLASPSACPSLPLPAQHPAPASARHRPSSAPPRPAHLPLERHRRQQAVKGRLPVGGHYHQLVAQVVRVPHLALRSAAQHSTAWCSGAGGAGIIARWRRSRG